MAPTASIRITADDREAGSSVVESLRTAPGVDLRIARLPVGDYLIDDLLLIERKTLPDLMASIKDGRLFSQALRLVDAAPRVAVLLEGRSRELVVAGMRREAVQGALISITVFLGIPLLRSMDAAESARLMLYAARQQRAYAYGALPRKGRRPRGKGATQNRILQGLPGVGPERARRLLQRFGSVESVMTAEREQLRSVDGIGESTAKAIRWAVEDAAATYAAGVGAPVRSPA
ncbi:MAG: ERCC4 domain-containing protein [Thiohalocapsa sp.]|jgi:ERCC4-type nuclease